jgi:kynurenine formamidase
MANEPPTLTREEVEGFHRKLSNWGRFGDRDQLGTLNFVRPEHRVAAARLVRSGRNVSCSRPLPTESSPENPNPVVHLMSGTATEGWGGDYFAIAPHGFATSHIDALCHIFHEGKLYNGYPSERVTSHGALELAIHELRDGVVSRGVLLDVPRARGVPFLEPGDAISPLDLERADRWAYRSERGAWDARQTLAGLHASCLPWLHEREVASLGCDGVSDVIPSRVDGVPLPIHTIGIVAMGLHLLDNLDLEGLAEASAEEGRWEFLVTIAPLVLLRGTASPVNPIAVF